MFDLIFLLSAGLLLAEAASTDGHPETDTVCQGHKTHGNPTIMDSAARQNSGRWTWHDKKNNPITGSTWLHVSINKHVGHFCFYFIL